MVEFTGSLGGDLARLGDGGIAAPGGDRLRRAFGAQAVRRGPRQERLLVGVRVRRAHRGHHPLEGPPACYGAAGVPRSPPPSRARLPATGLLGFLAAPLAFEVSRVLHKGTLEALAASGGGDELSPLFGATIKGRGHGGLGRAVSRAGAAGGRG